MTTNYMSQGSSVLLANSGVGLAKSRTFEVSRDCETNFKCLARNARLARLRNIDFWSGNFCNFLKILEKLAKKCSNSLENAF